MELKRVIEVLELTERNEAVRLEEWREALRVAIKVLKEKYDNIHRAALSNY